MLPFFMLELFQNYLEKEKRCSAHTVIAYINDLKQMFIFFEVDENDIAEIKSFTPNLIRSYVVHLVKSGLEPKSIARKLSAGRTLFRFMMSRQLTDNNPFANIKGPKVPKRIPEFVQKTELTTEKIDSLFTDDIFGFRDKLIFELLYQTGIRLSELIEIKESDISGGQVRVTGKRNKQRIIALGDDLTRQIDGFIALKNQQAIAVDYLFFTDTEKKLYPKFVYRKINLYLSQLTTINKKSPHIMRHTFATHMLNEGAGLEVLKEILGHANLAATQVYTHNSFEQINSIYKSAHPRGHKT